MPEPIPAEAVRLPYPHSRNDCEMCRERDADVHILGDEYNHPGKRPLILCRACLGTHGVMRAIADSGPHLDQPVIITLTVAPERRPTRA